MKGKRYTEEQIIRILREVDAGKPVAEACREYKVAEATIYRWRRRYRGMDEAQLRRLKELETENTRLKKIVAQPMVGPSASPGHRCVEGVAGKRIVSPQAKRQCVRRLVEEWGYSERRACPLVDVPRSTARYQPRRQPSEAALRERVRDLACRHKSYGYRRIAHLIRREGSNVNEKRIHRIWKAEGLQLCKRKRKKRRYGPQGEVIQKARHRNHVWTYDFAEDRTEKGRCVRFLSVLDEFTRECLAIEVGHSLSSQDVIQLLEWLFLLRGSPEHLRSDNGPELIAKAVQQWLAERQCNTIYITPGSPWENPYIESFIGKLKEECLDRYVLVNVREAKEIVEHWRQEYNEFRPHSSLNYLTPVEFAAQQQAEGHHNVLAGQLREPILSL